MIALLFHAGPGLAAHAHPHAEATTLALFLFVLLVAAVGLAVHVLLDLTEEWLRERR